MARTFREINWRDTGGFGPEYELRICCIDPHNDAYEVGLFNGKYLTMDYIRGQTYKVDPTFACQACLGRLIVRARYVQGVHPKQDPTCPCGIHRVDCTYHAQSAYQPK